MVIKLIEEDVMGEINKLYDTLEQMCLDINPDLIIKRKIIEPEGAPSILFSIPQITPNDIPQLSDEEHKTVTLQTVLLTKGNDPSSLIDLYEDFLDAFYNNLYGLIKNNGIECARMEIGRFIPQNDIFGQPNNDNVLNGEISFNIKL